MEVPESLPRNHVTRIAEADLTAPSSASARPFFRATTVGRPTAATASASCCWIGGTTICVRDCASPENERGSPIASTTTSAQRLPGRFHHQYFSIS
jgi:hypothetical protein